MRKINTVAATDGVGFTSSAVVRRFINETDVTVVNVDAPTYVGNLESLVSVSGYPHYFISLSMSIYVTGRQWSVYFGNTNPMLSCTWR